MEILSEIAADVGTPLYVYDAEAFRARAALLERLLADAPHVVCYAVKANDALAVLRVAADNGLGADVVSGGELFKALRAGIPARTDRLLGCREAPRGDPGGPRGGSSLAERRVARRARPDR